MTTCPIAIAVGCKKCALFKVCPLKTVIGDYKPEEDAKAEEMKQEPKEEIVEDFEEQE